MCECVTKRSKRLFNNAWKILVGHKREKTRIWCLKGYFKKYHLLLHPSSILPMKYISISFYILPLWNYFGMEWILIVNRILILYYTISFSHIGMIIFSYLIRKSKPQGLWNNKDNRPYITYLRTPSGNFDSIKFYKNSPTTILIAFWY